MSITNPLNKKTYTLDGATTVFAYDFFIYADSEMTATVTNKTTGAITATLVLNVDFTVSGAGNTNFGNVTLIGNLYDSDEDLVLLRVIPFTQELAFKDNIRTPQATWSEGYDRAVMLSQQLKEEVDRSIKVNIGATVTPVLPSPVDNNALVWDGVDGTIKNSPYDTTALDASVAAAAASAASASSSSSSASTSETNASASEAAAAASAATFGVKGSDVASASSITLGSDGDYFDITGTTDITSITIKAAGKVVRLQFDGILTVTDGSNLKLQGDFVTAAERTLTLISDGTNWIEKGRTPTSNFKVVTTTRDLTTATGTQAITGVGFKPKTVIAICAIGADARACIGFSDGTSPSVIYPSHDGTADNWGDSDFLINVDSGASIRQSAVVNSFDSDGLTLSWVKTGSPTGTLKVKLLCFG